MQTLAIIAEYNPFHNGHAYMLEKSRELTGADYAISIIGGNFLQRGQAAMWHKYDRAEMAAAAGIDLCIELPFPYATGSARDFADGAVRILNSLGCVDYLCFGAETDDLKLLLSIADIAVDEPDIYKDKLRELSKSGCSYPAARAAALSHILSHSNHFNDRDINEVLATPNNILAIEYLCALKRINSHIKPVIIKRQGSGYHDRDLNQMLCSATAIRKAMDRKDSDPDFLKSFMPESTLTRIDRTYKKNAPIYENDITPFLQSALLNRDENIKICDINPDLSDKIKKLPVNISMEAAVDKLKSKDITASRISRALMHMILQYTESDRETFIQNGYAFYANVLALKKESSALLKFINTNGQIPLITKKADFNFYLEKYHNLNKNAAYRQWELDTRASLLYSCMVYNRYGVSMPHDFARELPVL